MRDYIVVKYYKYLPCHHLYSSEKITESNITCPCINVDCLLPQQVKEMKVSVHVNGRHIMESYYVIPAICDYTY